jgi:hypothetical protein
MAYKRLIIHGDGSREFLDFTPDQATDKDAQETTTAATRTDYLARRLRRAQAIRTLKAIAADNTSQFQPMARLMLRLWLVEFTDPDDPDPTA